MVEMDVLDSFLKQLFNYLVGRLPKASDETKIFRKHNNKLEAVGELSFPLNRSGWAKYEESNDVKIMKYIKKFDENLLNESEFVELIDESKTWGKININSIKIHQNKVNIFLNRIDTFKIVITLILQEKENYRGSNVTIKSITIDSDYSKNSSDLTTLRLQLLENVTKKMLSNSGCKVTDKSGSAETVFITNKSESECKNKKIVCGVVISNKFGKKNTDVSAEEFYRKRTVDMQLMAQHKYGVRVNSEPGWGDFFKQLGNAAVIIDLLHVKPSRPVIINEDHAASTCCKGASFILYNCARLSEIFKRFKKKVASGEMPPLPSIEDTDFTLLNQPEEWELLYVFLMQYPSTVKSCIADILQCKLNTHNLCVFLDALCSTFSVYYRRIRVLTEARSHLFGVMHARIRLLQGIQQVLHNALALLDIPPIEQM